VADDWRVTIELDTAGDGVSFAEAMRELALERDARRRLGERVAVSVDGSRVLLYADTESAALEAQRAVEPLLSRHRLDESRATLARWHPQEEAWEDAARPLPSTPEERAAEHAEAAARDARATDEQGFAEWEVRAELPGHRETVEFAQRLRDEGLPVLRRWTYLLVGAPSEDAARELARRIRAEAPEGTRVEAEVSGAAIWKVADPFPFAVFGGLGG
jgi:hypothetical protein